MSDPKTSSDQILSVEKLEGFGGDNFSDYKFDSKDTSDSSSQGSGADVISSDSEHSEVTARCSDSCSDSSSGRWGEDGQSGGSASPTGSPLPQGIPKPPAKAVPRSRVVRYSGPEGPPESNRFAQNMARVLNGEQKTGVDTTRLEDENNKQFTIIHDVPPRGSTGPCKRCPKMQFVGIQEWWKVQQNLHPRARHSLKISLGVLGSVLLLLAIFLLARLPSGLSDVSRTHLYDLPSDDAFRPPHPHPQMEMDYPDLQDIGRLPGENPNQEQDSYPKNAPGRMPSLREKIQRKSGALPAPISTDYLELEASRRLKMSQQPKNISYAERARRVATELVKDIVSQEKAKMEDIEKNIWAEGATSLKVLLVSTWRSGSTFLGQVLQQHPGVFQHYEPFSFMGVKQIRSGSAAFQSQQLLHRLLECRFDGQTQYLNYSRENPTDMIGHNKRIWKPCKFNNFVEVCSNASFLKDTCNMFPIQLVKTVRLRLNLTQLFLGENRLNSKVVFLVRDPRATISSRMSSVDWCSENKDCYDPEVLCSDLKEDLKVSAAFERLYPNSFIRVKYEDLANEPQRVMQELLNFLGMEYTEDLKKFVKEHTESEVDAPWSIARKSTARVNRWMDKLTTEKVEEIERACGTVLEKLNYELYSN